jgi:hypothetical protein
MHVAPAERHVGDEVDGRPAEQRRGGDDLQLVLDVAERLLEADAMSTIPATIGKCR